MGRFKGKVLLSLNSQQTDNKVLLLSKLRRFPYEKVYSCVRISSNDGF